MLLTKSDETKRIPGAPEGGRPWLGPLHPLYERFAHLIHEVGKFGIIGGIAFIIDIGLFNGLSQVDALDGKPLTRKVISMVIAATFAFLGNRHWTWRHRPRTSLRREYGLYLVFNVVGLMLALIPLGLSHYVLGAVWPATFKTLIADNISANIIGTIFGTMFRFWSFRKWVFLKDEPAAEEALV